MRYRCTILKEFNTLGLSSINSSDDIKVEKKESEDDIATLKINDINNTANNTNDKDVSKLKNEIENYKNKLSEMNIELKKNEELRHQNILLAHKLQEASKKVAQANQVISKAKKIGRAHV